MSTEKIMLPKYTKGEEIFNSVSHGIGIPFGIAALVLCLMKTTNASGLLASVIFSIAVVILYGSSTVYHALRPGSAKKIMRIVDHSVIFILISGTSIAMTLLCAYPYNKVFAVVLISAISLMSILGIVLTFVDQEKFKVIQMVLYIFVGWCSISLAYPIFKYCDNAKMIFIYTLLGGIVYTLGTIFYGLGRDKKYFHSIFHLFVFAGTVLHFLAIYTAI